ncbi:MAG TPA: hypothetical protein VF600_10020 [Abditibacteriaceae bacterium]|jgi:hypothetical protein
MNCLQCGYNMDAFDEECRRCHGMGVTAKPVAVPQHSSKRDIIKWARFAALGLLLSFGCYKLWFKAYTYSQQDEVLEAVLRHRIRPDAKAVIFVSVAGQDPPQALLNHFTNDNLSVRKWSQALKVPTQNEFKRVDPQVNEPFRYDYTDKHTGEVGAPLTLDSPIWSGSFQASVYSDSFFGGDRYIVVRKNGRWVVDRKEMGWIA